MSPYWGGAGLSQTPDLSFMFVTHVYYAVTSGSLEMRKMQGGPKTDHFKMFVTSV